MSAEIIDLAAVREQQREDALARELDDLRDLLEQFGPREVECMSFYGVPFLGSIEATCIPDVNVVE